MHIFNLHNMLHKKNYHFLRHSQGVQRYYVLKYTGILKKKEREKNILNSIR